MTMRKLATMILAATLAPFWSGDATADSLTVPGGSPIQLDGTVDSAEWAGALVVDLSDGHGTIRFLHDGAFLYAAFTVDSGYPHLAVMAPGSVYILHASHALGDVEYAQKDSLQWIRKYDFTWEIRDTSLSDTARAERDKFLSDHGWVASSMDMGRPGETEFIVHLELFDNTPLRVAAAAGSGSVPPGHWPAELEDGAQNFDLFLGKPPQVLTFNSTQWASLRLGPVRKP